MIYIVQDTKLIDAYIEKHRDDKESEKPYYIPIVDNDGSITLPNDQLIIKALHETGTPYTLVLDIEGKSIQIDSDSLQEDPKE